MEALTAGEILANQAVLAIVGVVISAITQFAKKRGWNPWTVLTLLSGVVGTVVGLAMEVAPPQMLAAAASIGTTIAAWTALVYNVFKAVSRD